MKAFVQGQFVCIDIVMSDGRSQIARENLDQIRLRYPGAEIADLDSWAIAKEKALCTEPGRSHQRTILGNARSTAAAKLAAWKKLRIVRDVRAH